MRTHGKKFRKAAEKHDIVKSYAPKQALEIVRVHCRFLQPGDLEPILGGTLKRLLDNAAPTRTI